MLRRCIVALLLSSAALTLTGTNTHSSSSSSFITGAHAQSSSASPAVTTPKETPAAVSASPAATTTPGVKALPTDDPCLHATPDPVSCVDVTGQTEDPPSKEQLEKDKKPPTLKNKQHHRFCFTKRHDPTMPASAGATINDDADELAFKKTFARFEKNVDVCVVMGINLSMERTLRKATNQELTRTYPETSNHLPSGRIPGQVKVQNHFELAGTAYQGNSVVFPVQVDQFSMLYLDKSHSSATKIADDTSMTGLIDPFKHMRMSGGDESKMHGYEKMEIQIEVGGVASPPVPRRGGKNNELLVPFWTAIVRLDNGKVFDIEWDKGCFSCDEDQCVDGNFCAENMTSKPNYCVDEDCNLRIYLAWIGTDADGHYMTSAGMRFSQFTKYSASDAVKNAYASSKDAYNDAKDGVNEANDKVKGN